MPVDNGDRSKVRSMLGIFKRPNIAEGLSAKGFQAIMLGLRENTTDTFHR